MNTEEIIEKITSRDTHNVWQASCYIIECAQNAEAIKPLIQYLPKIKETTAGLEMGGAFAPNQRFVDLAIRTIEFHKAGVGCPCNLFIRQSIDPNKEQAKGNFQILETIRVDGKWVDHYRVKCLKCAQEFRVQEGESHYTWWDWRVSLTNHSTNTPAHRASVGQFLSRSFMVLLRKIFP